MEADLPRGPVTAPLLAALPEFTVRVPVAVADLPLLPVTVLLKLPCTGGFLRVGWAGETPAKKSGNSKAGNHQVILLRRVIFLLP